MKQTYKDSHASIWNFVLWQNHLFFWQLTGHSLSYLESSSLSNYQEVIWDVVIMLTTGVLLELVHHS